MENYELYIIRSGLLFGATCSQFLLNATVLHHLTIDNSATSKCLLRNIYVDNVQNSFSTEAEMCNFYESSKFIMESAGFPLRQWVSNSGELNKKSMKNGDCADKLEKTKILGISWDLTADTLGIVPPKINLDCKTKREIVGEISKVYEPLGLVLPITIRGRILIQKVWKTGISWDENVPDD